MKQFLNKILGTSPMTTILGYLAAIITIVTPIVQDGAFDIHKDWKNLLVAIGAAIWGRIQKDSNGITAAQSKEIHETVEVIKTEVPEVAEVINR